MPKMVKIGPAKGYHPPKGDTQAASEWEKVKARGVLEVDYVNANEALQYGKGMYQILPEAAPETAPTASPGVRLPEQMTRDELVLTALQLGIDLSKKQMKKDELVKAVRLKLDEVQLLADDDEGSGAE